MTPQPTEPDHTPIRDADDVAAVAEQLQLTPRTSLGPTWDGPGLTVRVPALGSGPFLVQVLVHADHDRGRDAWDAALHYGAPRYALSQLVGAIVAARGSGHTTTITDREYRAVWTADGSPLPGSEAATWSRGLAQAAVDHAEARGHETAHVETRTVTTTRLTSAWAR